MAHPQSRAERRNIKFKRGEYGKREEVPSIPPKKLKEFIKDQESLDELREATKASANITEASL
jgi:hypothetical protein